MNKLPQARLLCKKHSSFERLLKNLNKKIETIYSSIKVIYVYKVSDKNQNISSLIDKIINENPYYIAIHESLINNLYKDDRFVSSSVETVVCHGVWGYINNIKVYCYNVNTMPKENMIFLFSSSNQIDNSAIRVLGQ